MEDPEEEQHQHKPPSQHIHSPTPRRQQGQRQHIFELPPLQTASLNSNSYSSLPIPGASSISSTPSDTTSAPPSRTSLQLSRNQQQAPSASSASAIITGATDMLNAGAGTGSITPSRDRERESNKGDKPHKSHSIVNLTSPTLWSIYSPAGDDPNATPFASGAVTPIRKNSSFTFSTSQLSAERLAEISRTRRKSSAAASTPGSAVVRPRIFAEGERNRGLQHLLPKSRRRRWVERIGRLVVLFCVGVAYGEFVTRVHDTPEIAPVTIGGIPRKTRSYLAFWGVVAVLLGSALPWLDSYGRSRGAAGARRKSFSFSAGEKARLVDEDEDVHNGKTTISTFQQQEQDAEEDEDEDDDETTHVLGADWNPIVRTIGAFVGIAFAIRRLPWQSTLQLSLTLALVNPAIWYLVDRSRTGLLLAITVATVGATSTALLIPDVLLSDLIPSPASSSVFSSSSPSRLRRIGFGSESGRALNSSTLASNTAAGAGGAAGTGSNDNGGGGGGGMMSYEFLSLTTWVGSVLFCSCICFGNLGRRLKGHDHDHAAGYSPPYAASTTRGSSVGGEKVAAAVTATAKSSRTRAAEEAVADISPPPSLGTGNGERRREREKEREKGRRGARRDEMR